ncbi:hypothetical protein GE21DRAFT_1355173 [Neurospora crassa]|nr:hypothetical protein GE21DRAFT_1355173 [Neurospora crassa]
MASNGHKGEGLFNPGLLRIGQQRQPHQAMHFLGIIKTYPVDAELVVPPPDQISKGETIPCATVSKISEPDLDTDDPMKALSSLLLTT